MAGEAIGSVPGGGVIRAGRLPGTSYVDPVGNSLTRGSTSRGRSKNTSIPGGPNAEELLRQQEEERKVREAEANRLASIKKQQQAKIQSQRISGQLNSSINKNQSIPNSVNLPSGPGGTVTNLFNEGVSSRFKRSAKAALNFKKIGNQGFSSYVNDIADPFQDNTVSSLIDVELVPQNIAQRGTTTSNVTGADPYLSTRGKSPGQIAVILDTVAGENISDIGAPTDVKIQNSFNRSQTKVNNSIEKVRDELQKEVNKGSINESTANAELERRTKDIIEKEQSSFNLNRQDIIERGNRRSKAIDTLYPKLGTEGLIIGSLATTGAVSSSAIASDIIGSSFLAEGGKDVLESAYNKKLSGKERIIKAATGLAFIGTGAYGLSEGIALKQSSILASEARAARLEQLESQIFKYEGKSRKIYNEFGDESGSLIDIKGSKELPGGLGTSEKRFLIQVSDNKIGGEAFSQTRIVDPFSEEVISYPVKRSSFKSGGIYSSEGSAIQGTSNLNNKDVLIDLNFGKGSGKYKGIIGIDLESNEVTMGRINIINENKPKTSDFIGSSKKTNEGTILIGAEPERIIFSESPNFKGRREISIYKNPISETIKKSVKGSNNNLLDDLDFVSPNSKMFISDFTVRGKVKSYGIIKEQETSEYGNILFRSNKKLSGKYNNILSNEGSIISSVKQNPITKSGGYESSVGGVVSSLDKELRITSKQDLGFVRQRSASEYKSFSKYRTGYSSLFSNKNIESDKQRFTQSFIFSNPSKIYSSSGQGVALISGNLLNNINKSYSNNKGYSPLLTPEIYNPNPGGGFGSGSSFNISGLDFGTSGGYYKKKGRREIGLNPSFTAINLNIRGKTRFKAGSRYLGLDIRPIGQTTRKTKRRRR